jgi:hypothetical protein
LGANNAAPRAAQLLDKRTKAAARAAVARRRARSADPERPAAVVADKDALTGLDPDLDQMFTPSEASAGKPAAAGKDPELDGIFRTERGEQNGPNGSPLLD